MATLGSIFAGTWLAAGGGAKPKTAQGPPINASSKDEENFIQYVNAVLGCQSQLGSSLNSRSNEFTDDGYLQKLHEGGRRR